LPDGTSRTASYDANGNVVNRTDIFGAVWSYTYSANGQIQSVRDPAGNITTYGHDSHGSIDRITDPLGHTSTLVHDALGRPIRRTLPGGQSATCAYDGLARPTSCTDFAGNITQFTYDSTARTVQRAALDGTERRSFNADNQLVRVDDARGATTLTRDGLNRLLSWTGPDGNTVQYVRDGSGRVISITSSTGTTTLTYNGRGELASVVDPGGTTSYSRDLDGRPTAVTFANGVTLANGYDTVGRITRITYTLGPSTVLLDLLYTRDSSGRITRVQESTGRDVSYTYDALGRLIEERTTAPSSETITYDYDPSGNLARRADNAGAQLFSYDSNDRLLSDGISTYTWDANGNLATRTTGTTTETFTYDSRNRLIGFARTGSNPTTVTYAYDPDGLLASRTADGVLTRLLWDRATAAFPQILEERDATNALLRRYEHGDLSITHARDANGNTSLLLSDHLGTVRALTASNGTVTTRFVSDAYGRPQGVTPSGIGYTGGYTDPASGFVFMRSRWYAPAIARFIQPDVAPADYFDARVLNRYVYSLNDPVDRFDPSGRTNLAELSFYSAIVFTLAGVTSIALADPQEVVASGFGLGNAKKHWGERKDAHFLPFGASGGLGVTRAGKIGLSGGLTGNIEMLEFDTLKKEAIYISLGSEFGLGVGTPDSEPPGLGASGQTQGGVGGVLGSGPVYNTPQPQHYTGWFVSLSGSAGLSLNAELGGNKNLTGGAGIGGTIFWSPTPTYAIYPKDPEKTPLPAEVVKNICPGCEYRYGHGLKLSIGSGLSASISLTWTFWIL
jgi:RHS repeat-associated protein